MEDRENLTICMEIIICKCNIAKGPFLYSVRTWGWVDGSENGNFPLLYLVKMSLRRWVGGSKKPKNTLT